MRILHATDGSTASKEGQRLIASLFDPATTSVDVYCAHPEVVYAVPPVDYSYELERLDVGPFGAEEIARESAEHLAEAGFTVSSSSGRGDPATHILQKLQDEKHELVVLGGSHTTWMGTLLLGSVSMHVLHHAACSVVVAHKAPTGTAKVLVAADGSEGSSIAIDTAAKILDRSKCSIRVATAVWEPWVPVGVYPPAFPLRSHVDYEAEESRLVERAWETVERARAQLNAAGFESDGAVLLGQAGPQLLKEADNFGADLVVAGSRGLGPVRRAYLGSVSDQIVRHSAAALIGRMPK